MMQRLRIRQIARRFVPHALRLLAAQTRRRVRDRLSGQRSLFATVEGPNPGTQAHCFSISQPIRQTAHYEGKLHNLQRAAKILDGITIPPGKILSFWHLVGEPSARNGFQLGRAIRGDVLSADIGGGLCQISGLIYELGLRAGLAIVERHAHTQDLYTPESRFAPLGLDATIVWGFKDLRLRNDFAQAVTLTFDVSPHQICGGVLAAQVFAPLHVQTQCQDVSGGASRIVQVSRSNCHGGIDRISRDVYAVPEPQPA